MIRMKRLAAGVRREADRFRRDTRGGVIALTALTLPVILLISALSVDLGILYLAKSRAESVAMFAAESGVERMPDQMAAAALAQDVGTALLKRSELSAGHRVDVTTDASTITVEIEIEVNAVFGHMAGLDVMKATARVSRAR